MKKEFKVIPLGGLKEIGKNCTAIDCDGEILIIDCGFAFPEYEMFGIDIVIPDFTYLRDNMERIKGMIITHGHEDHIGSIPYLLQEVNIPIYGGAFTAGLIKNKLDEFDLYADINVVSAGDVFTIGNYTIEAIQTNHSIVDSLAYSIDFPGGRIIHTGDFKIDYSPLDGKVIDLNRLSQLGDEGVDLLICDSTNVLREGYTPSEAVVRKSIDEIFDNNDKRIIIATFASNVHRIKYILESSMKHHRKVAFTGRSMDKSMQLARELGYLLDIPESILVSIDKIKDIPDDKLTIITTGSQGEPMSALTRMANDNHKDVKLKKGDMVVFSSSPIPGNEKVVTQVVNKLYEKRVEVVLASAMDVHVSGHAAREELKIIHSLVRPKYFMPAHGEYRHLIEHARLANSLGMGKDKTFVMSNGDALIVNDDQAKIAENFTSGEDIMVDGYGVGDVGSIVLKDRKTLSQSGLMVIAIAIDQATGSLMSEPQLISRGFVYVQENLDLIEEAKNVVYNSLGCCFEKEIYDEATLVKTIKSDMKAYIYRETKRNPVILPMILYV
ncbi:MAG: ribonuclease J [Clostridiales bacterium]|nr:ribonuclease J [Candidatus Crickella equi]